MDALKYLERIKYRGPAPATLNVLQQLQAAHLRHVPFENLDIHLGRLIELGRSYEKVVLAGRGGFCYELNGLFYELLQSLGFVVKLVSARGANKTGGFGPEFDHLAIIATIAGTHYLVDVGFGDFTFAPLRLELDAVQEDQAGRFRIVRHDAHYLVVQKLLNETWTPEYLFTDAARQLSDFAAMCRYHQTSPDSPFTRKRLCSLPTESGRVTLTGDRLLKTADGKVTETALAGEEGFRKALRQHFNITL